MEQLMYRCPITGWRKTGKEWDANWRIYDQVRHLTNHLTTAFRRRLIPFTLDEKRFFNMPQQPPIEAL